MLFVVLAVPFLWWVTRSIWKAYLIGGVVPVVLVTLFFFVGKGDTLGACLSSFGVVFWALSLFWFIHETTEWLPRQLKKEQMLGIHTQSNNEEGLS